MDVRQIEQETNELRRETLQVIKAAAFHRGLEWGWWIGLVVGVVLTATILAPFIGP